jgi:hypothetical protein
MEDGRQGRFEVLAQSGHVVGASTYLPMGEARAVQDVSALLGIRPLAIR